MNVMYGSCSIMYGSCSIISLTDASTEVFTITQTNKVKVHPTLCLSRHRREAQVYFQHIRNVGVRSRVPDQHNNPVRFTSGKYPLEVGWPISTTPRSLYHLEISVRSRVADQHNTPFALPQGNNR